MTQIKTKIPAELEPAAVGGMVTDSKYVKDRVKNKTQEEVNTDTEGRVSTLEESVGTGGSVDERISVEKNRAEQAEGVLDGKVANEKQRAEGVEGGLNTRLQTVEQLAEISVGGGDIGIGTAADFESDDPEDLAKVPTVGAMLGGANDGVYDISARHSGTKYADLAAALGTDGANVPVGVRKGGMSVKFVQTSDNNYIQFRCISDEFTTDTTKWALSNEEVVIDNPEYIYVKTDIFKKLLFAIRESGIFEFFSGTRGIKTSELTNDFEFLDKTLFIEKYPNLNELEDILLVDNDNGYIRLTTDNQNKVLSYIDSKGKHYELPVFIKDLLIGDVNVKDSLLISKIGTCSIDNTIKSLDTDKGFVEESSDMAVISNIVTIDSQEDFETLPTILSNISQDTIIQIKKGHYSFNDVIEINDKNYSSYIVRIIGEDGVSISNIGEQSTSLVFLGLCNLHNVYQYESFDRTKTRFFTSDGNIIELCNSTKYWNNISYTDNDVEIIDSNTHYCRLHLAQRDMLLLSDYDNVNGTKSCDNLNMWFDQSFYGSIVNIDKIENGWVYFYKETIYGDNPAWAQHPNSQWLLNKIRARYIIYNAAPYLTEDTALVENDTLYIPIKYKEFHTSVKNKFLHFNRNTFKEFLISGISFYGGGMLYPTSPLIDDLSDSLLRFTDCFNIKIKNCIFKNIGAEAVCSSEGGENFIFKNNIIDGSLLSGVISMTENTEIAFNVLSEICQIPAFKYGISFTNKIGGHIHDNIIKNFSYSGIRFGTRYNTGVNSSNDACKCIVENNLVYWDNDFFARYEEHSLCDGGAIYTTPLNNGSIVRDNIVYQYRLLNNGHGIYFDDGTTKTSCYRNLISRVYPDYAIFWRYSKLTDGTIDYNPNVDCNMAYNIIGGAVLFKGGYKEGTSNGCLKGSNIQICKDCNIEISSEYSGLESSENDIIRTLAYFSLESGLLGNARVSDTIGWSDFMKKYINNLNK